PEGRGEHDQQQKSGTPAVSSPHLRNSISVPSTQLPVPCGVASGYWVLIPVPFLRAWAGEAAVEDNSEAGVDSGGRPLGGGGFRRGGFCGFALSAARVAGRVGDRSVGGACESQAARRRGG